MKKILLMAFATSIVSAAQAQTAIPVTVQTTIAPSPTRALDLS